MGTVRILQNVYSGGEVKYRADAEIDLDGHELAAALRRGWAVAAGKAGEKAEKAEKTSKAGEKRKDD